MKILSWFIAITGVLQLLRAQEQPLLLASEIKELIQDRDPKRLETIHRNLAGYLESKDPATREMAITAAYFHGLEVGDAPPLKKSYELDLDARVRSAALRALGALMDRSLEAASTVGLAIKPPYEADDVIAAEICARSPVPEAGEGLLGMAENGSVPQKLSALRALLNLSPLPPGIEPLLASIKGEADEQRRQEEKFFERIPPDMRDEQLKTSPATLLLGLVKNVESRLQEGNPAARGSRLSAMRKDAPERASIPESVTARKEASKDVETPSASLRPSLPESPRDSYGGTIAWHWVGLAVAVAAGMGILLKLLKSAK